MRAHIRASLLIAAVVLAGCAEVTAPAPAEKVVEGSGTGIDGPGGGGTTTGGGASGGTPGGTTGGQTGGGTVDGTLPELPRDTVDVSLPAVTGRSIAVAAGADLQAALDAAQPGDELVLQAGATYTGSFTLRAKSGTGWIIIRSSGALPAAGTRVTPGDASRMARLVAPNAALPVIETEPGAHHYRLMGLEVTAVPGATIGYALVALGDGSRAQNTMELQPHHLVLDRVYIHGTPTLSFQRCVGLNSAWTAIVDSWLSECHAKGFDSQAIAGWNGTGPYKIVNNRLEGAGENVMFGGADPAIPNALPSDIEIRRNHFIKPPEWKGVWTAKNLLELKIGRRILIEGNVLENSWADGQVGFALVFKSTNQEGAAPWSETRDVTFRFNLVRNAAHGASIADDPELYPVVPASRMLFEHNVFDRIGTGGSSGRMFQVQSVDDLTLSHNTTISSHTFLLLVASPTPTERLTVADNVFSATEYGLIGDGTGSGTAALNTFAPGWTFRGNIVAGVDSGRYPSGNTYVATTADIGFANYQAGDLSLPSRTPSTPGANFAAVQSRTSGVIR